MLLDQSSDEAEDGFVPDALPGEQNYMEDNGSEPLESLSHLTQSLSASRTPGRVPLILRRRVSDVMVGTAHNSSRVQEGRTSDDPFEFIDTPTTTRDSRNPRQQQQGSSTPQSNTVVQTDSNITTPPTSIPPWLSRSSVLDTPRRPVRRTARMSTSCVRHSELSRQRYSPRRRTRSAEPTVGVVVPTTSGRLILPRTSLPVATTATESPPMEAATTSSTTVAPIVASTTNTATTTTTTAATRGLDSAIESEMMCFGNNANRSDSSGRSIMWGLCRICSTAINRHGGDRLTRSWLSNRHDERISVMLTAADQNLIPPRYNWRSYLAVIMLQSWVPRLASTMMLVNQYFAEVTNRNDQELLAPSVWGELTRLLALPLASDNDLMTILARARGIEQFNQPLPELPVTEQVSSSQCRVCLDRVAGTAITGCGHVFCRICVNLVRRCPVCRRSVDGRLDLFF